MLLMTDIIRDGHPTLREKAQIVAFPLADEVKQKALDMVEFLKMSQDEQLSEKYDLRAGVGLAAPQINLPLQFLALYTPISEEETVEMLMFNPKIISHSEKMTYLSNGEGCLSVDEEIEGIVPRHKKITVRFQDINGEVMTKSFFDFLAIVVQHEIDHLNGIMFYDRINKENPMVPPENSVEI